MKLTIADYRDSPEHCEGAWTFCLVPRSMPVFPTGATIYYRARQCHAPIHAHSENEPPALTQGEVREFRVFYWRSDSLPAAIPAAVRVK